jgi:hypothetical protein
MRAVDSSNPRAPIERNLQHRDPVPPPLTAGSQWWHFAVGIILAAILAYAAMDLFGPAQGLAFSIIQRDKLTSSLEAEAAAKDAEQVERDAARLKEAEENADSRGAAK